MKPISKTAFYCAGVRMFDAESANPLIGDHYARLLLGEEGLKYWQRFEDLKRPAANTRARHYLIETWLKDILKKKPGSTVILIGAGLDSRSFRLTGGNWVEIDEEAIIAYKNDLLPAETCPNKLDRIAISFAGEKLTDKLAVYAGSKDVIFIIEGVLMYLGPSEKEKLLNALTEMFPHHILFCDIMTKLFLEKFAHSIESRFRESGAAFTDLRDKPAELFLKHRYKMVRVKSTLVTAAQKRLLPKPTLIMRLFFRKYLMGYAVYCFSYHRNK